MRPALGLLQVDHAAKLQKDSGVVSDSFAKNPVNCQITQKWVIDSSTLGHWPMTGWA